MTDCILTSLAAEADLNSSSYPCIEVSSANLGGALALPLVGLCTDSFAGVISSCRLFLLKGLADGTSLPVLTADF